MWDDIIAAISTPPGEGGIAIIRASGSGVIDRIDPIFVPRFGDRRLQEVESFRLMLGYIRGFDGEYLDEVLLSVMRGPGSYTGEDLVEINCHGGVLTARRCLERVIATGIRPAEPGEFTRRAFTSGRIDANQAEAVIDIIRAKTDKGLKLALRQLEGKNSEYIAALEEKVMQIKMRVEASIDFPEDVGDVDREQEIDGIKKAMDDINQMLEAGKRSEIYRVGIEAAICGKPNVGKSSLLNALLRKEKAIVTDIPGTTRDVVEDFINIRGIPVKIIDTAGIRQTEDPVEKIGVERAQNIMSEADVVIFMLDRGAGMTKEDTAIYNSIQNKRKVIIMVNKEDLEEKNISEQELEQEFSGVKLIKASIKNQEGVAELEEAIEAMALEGTMETDQLECMVNVRQKNALMKSREYLEDAQCSLQGMPLDCVAVDLQSVLEYLGEISGRDLKEEAINRIFAEFCIGK